MGSVCCWSSSQSVGSESVAGPVANCVVAGGSLFQVAFISGL